MDSWDEQKHDVGQQRASLGRVGRLAWCTCGQWGQVKPSLEALDAKFGIMPFSGYHWVASGGFARGVNAVVWECQAGSMSGSHSPTGRSQKGGGHSRRNRGSEQEVQGCSSPHCPQGCAPVGQRPPPLGSSPTEAWWKLRNGVLGFTRWRDRAGSRAAFALSVARRQAAATG